MLITLEEARHEPFRWDEVAELDLEELEIPELASLGSIACAGTVSAAQDGYLVRARLEYSQGLVCTRCLEASSSEECCDFELLVLVEEQAEEAPFDFELEAELAEQDLDTMTIVGETLDTLPLIREQIQLGVPMKPLCSSECRGLCPECGINLNQGDCKCVAPVDPRWSGLAALKAQLGSEDASES